jgi:threo-3-hydroxy-L-aspartate ammonia-lyase
VASPLPLDDILRAAERLDGIANRTPVLTSRTLDERTGGRLFLKAESFQRTGSFKFRGAYNTVSSLPPDEQRRGVCTVSSGNHAQALALAAWLVGVPAVILMPEDAPPAKLAATRGYGAEVVVYDRYSMPQAEAGRRLQEERGLTFVSSHDDPRISAGAGTAALELRDEVGDLDVLVAPIGGGGGMAGYSTVVKALCVGVRVVGAESAASQVNARSLAAGHRVDIDIPRTIADGQQLTTPGRFPFEVMKETVDEVVAVTDDQILDAMAFLFDRMKVVTEPSGAIATAAVLSGLVDVAGARVGVIISGGNVGVDRFVALLGGRS